MNHSSLQEFLNGEHDSLLTSIDLFRTLLPHHEHEASVHSGEEGRFIELALTQYLIDKLPSGIGVGGGFAVDIEAGWNSKQIDILLYDKINYSPIMKYGDAVVLPIQAIIGAFSVKRKLYKSQLDNEIGALTEIGSRSGGLGYPKPYLSIIAFDSNQNDVLKDKAHVFHAISDYYKPRIDCKSREHFYSWNELLDSVIVFDKFIIKGTNFTPRDNKKRGMSKYLWTGGNGTKRNLYIQHLLDGIHRAWYDSRRGIRPVGTLLAIPSGGMQRLGEIKFCVEDRRYTWDKFIPKQT
ncbi:MAG: DUF6602 domain-containing protein [Sulfuriferula sp.]